MADRVFVHHGTTFIWDEVKATQNLQKHGVAFEEAVTVFDDPLFILQDASRNDQHRDAAIGFSAAGRLLTVVHFEVEDECIRIISARRASPAEETIYAQ
ncbi:MAG: BrnT family toxin [Steroidobacteraceae bacterium]